MCALKLNNTEDCLSSKCFNVSQWLLVLLLLYWGLLRWLSGKGSACQCRRFRRQVWSLSWEDSLEKEMATHSSILAKIIPWTEEPDRLQSMDRKKSPLRPFIIWCDHFDQLFTFYSISSPFPRHPLIFTELLWILLYLHVYLKIYLFLWWWFSH